MFVFERNDANKFWIILRKAQKPDRCIEIRCIVKFTFESWAGDSSPAKQGDWLLIFIFLLQKQNGAISTMLYSKTFRS